MRKFVLVLLLAVPAFAQSLDKPRRITFFVSNPAIGWSEGGGGFADAGYGIAAEYRFAKVWSGELAVATEQHEDQLLFSGTIYKLRTYPVDVVVRRSFLTQTRWRPYLGAGVRYVSAPHGGPTFRDYRNRTSAQIAGGVEFNAAESWSLTFDVKQLIRNDDVVYDEFFKVSLGVGWRF